MTMASKNPRGEQAVAISASFTAIAAIFVGLRLYTRFFIVRCPGLEDYCIILAMICSIGLTICIGFQAQYGMGQHIKDLQPEVMVSSLKAFWASLMVYYLSLGLTKSSMLMQYRRVFTTPKFKIACWTVMAVVICYTIWTVFSSIFACIPVRAFWTREPGAKCINQFAMWFTNAAINILTDFAIIILPMPVIRGLNLGRRQKTALTAIFAVGGFVCIVSILRLHSLVAISNSTDPTYDNPPAATWSSVETNIGIICSCLPLLRPLADRWLPGGFTSSHKRDNNAAARSYATIGGNTSRRGQEEDYALDATKTFRTSSEDARDIQVITDITVQVDGRAEKVDGWRTPESNKEWKGPQRTSSIDTLVKDTAHVV